MLVSIRWILPIFHLLKDIKLSLPSCSNKTSQKEGLNLQHGLRYTSIICCKISSIGCGNCALFIWWIHHIIIISKFLHLLRKCWQNGISICFASVDRMFHLNLTLNLMPLIRSLTNPFRHTSYERDSFGNEYVSFTGGEQDWCLYTDKKRSSRNRW